MSDSDHRSQINDHFARLCEIVAKLRAPGGCPWDREQTHESLLPALIEEAYEVAGAGRAKDTDNFREELGDLLLLIVMHAEIAREAGTFNIDNVVNDVSEKLIRRHPHVFAPVAAGVSPAKTSASAAGTAAITGSAVLKQWEAIKREEKASQHYLDGLPSALPALMRAQKAQSKAARVNFDWSNVRDVVAKIDEELSELKRAIEKWNRHPADDSGGSRAGSPCHDVEDEIGDLLFAVVNVARKSGFDAESALQSATDKFVMRFNRLEEELRARGKKLGEVELAEMDEIWNEIKQPAGRRAAEP